MQGERHDQDFLELNQSSYPDMGFEGEVGVGFRPLNQPSEPPRANHLSWCSSGCAWVATRSQAEALEEAFPEWNPRFDLISASGQDLQSQQESYQGTNGCTNTVYAQQNHVYDSQDFIASSFNDAILDQVQSEIAFNSLDNLAAAFSYEDWLNAQSSLAPGAYATIANADSNMVLTYPALNDVNTTAPITLAPVASAIAQVATHHCSFTGCNKSFKRKSCRDRHEQVHRTTQAVHGCTITGCAARYRRADKLTEHMWKKHAELGYAKK